MSSFARSALRFGAALSLSLSFTFSFAPARAGDGTPAGRVIVARLGGNALLIWDASTDVAAIVTNKTPDADANARLERDAARILASSLGTLDKLDKDATRIAVRVIYDKTGAVSPAYGSATFAGVERYATLTMSAKDANADRDRWRELGDASPLPSWLGFEITGALPPR